MRQNPERLAWTIVLVAFSVLCITLISTCLLVRWFILDSTVSLVVELSVSRNTVGVLVEGHAEETERATRRLKGRVTLTTDSTSQALLTFRDPHSGAVLATFTLFHDSVVTISHTARPRFETSAKPYTIEVVGKRGHGDVIIAADDENGRGLRFRVVTVYNAQIDMAQRGYYSVVLGGDYIGVTTRIGEATLRYAGDKVAPVPLSYRGVVPGTDPAQPIEVSEAPFNLVYNSGFVLYEPMTGTPLLPAGWGCYNDQERLEEPRGETIRTTFEGRPVLHIRRGGERLNHAETGCRQLYSDMDLSAYSYLELRASFYIASQSISTCGIKGSECPLMLRIIYRDEAGELKEWIHGFYSTYNVSEWPLTCDTCRQEHERINAGTWYVYESGNLANILPGEAKMQELIEVRFYASGHAYEVMVDEVSLLAAP